MQNSFNRVLKPWEIGRKEALFSSGKIREKTNHPSFFSFLKSAIDIQFSEFSSRNLVKIF